jgi:hypothetical protein
VHGQGAALCLLFNASETEVTFNVPAAAATTWHDVFDTSSDGFNENCSLPAQALSAGPAQFSLMPHALAVLSTG